MTHPEVKKRNNDHEEQTRAFSTDSRVVVYIAFPESRLGASLDASQKNCPWPIAFFRQTTNQYTSLDYC
jgi:hypothetical protein